MHIGCGYVCVITAVIPANVHVDLYCHTEMQHTVLTVGRTFTLQIRDKDGLQQKPLA